MADKQSTDPLIAGFTAGVVSTSLLLPLDIVKVRLQVNETVGRRLGTMSLLRGILRHEGVAGIYQGWTPAVIGASVSWGGYFYFYEGLKRQLVAHKTGGDSMRPASEVLTAVDNFCLACTAGGIMVAITNPIWLIKTRIQLQMKKSSAKLNIKPYNGMLDAVLTIVREEGYLALYKGSGPAILLTSHGGVQFVVYEFLRKHFHYNRVNRTEPRGKQLTVLQRFELSTGYLTIGAVAKVIASITTYPLQVVKSRMQQRAQSVELTVDGDVKAIQRDYQGMMATARRIWRNEGPQGFFKGIIPNSLRVAPGAAITFLVYEAVMDMLSE